MKMKNILGILLSAILINFFYVDNNIAYANKTFSSKDISVLAKYIKDLEAERDFYKSKYELFKSEYDRVNIENKEISELFKKIVEDYDKRIQETDNLIRIKNEQLQLLIAENEELNKKVIKTQKQLKASQGLNVTLSIVVLIALL